MMSGKNKDAAPPAGTIQTISGFLAPSELGRTLTHEHLSMKFEKGFKKPLPEDAHNADVPLVMENLGWIRQNPYSHHGNLLLSESEEAVLESVKTFVKYGGKSMVENTSIGLERNMSFLNYVAETTGINIIAGTGYYIDEFLSGATKAASEEEIAARMRTDITVGWEGTNHKCGIIGELGCSWPLTDFEKRNLRAGAVVQSELGVPLIIHPGRHPDAPVEIIRILQEAGADLSHTIMSHLDRTIFDHGELLEFAKSGTICEWDCFGLEVSHSQDSNDIDMPSDAERIKSIKTLADAGFEDNIVIAHDIHTNHRLEKYGGHGYAHIFRNVVPKMLHKGISQEVVDKILIANPARVLAFH